MNNASEQEHTSHTIHSFHALERWPFELGRRIVSWTPILPSPPVAFRPGDCPNLGVSSEWFLVFSGLSVFTSPAKVVKWTSALNTKKKPR